MLSEKRLDTTELPRHLAQLVIAAEAAAAAFRELDYAAGLLRDFPVEMRMPIETAAVQQWQAWQEIERRGGTLINAWRIRQAQEVEEAANEDPAMYNAVASDDPRRYVDGLDYSTPSSLGVE